jgi:thiol-disulfide isomerase/thioredoxin
MPPTTTGKNLTGNGTLSLSALLGKPTAVVFWLNSCPHCQKALPAINRMSSSLESGQVVTAAIDAGIKGPKGFETPAAAVKTLRLKVPTILVANNVALNEWHVAATPTAYIIDSGGVITKVLQPKAPEKLAGDIKRALANTR